MIARPRPQRRTGNIPGFRFVKPKTSHKLYFNLALQDKIKTTVANHKALMSFDYSILNRQLINLTKVKNREIDIVLGNDRKKLKLPFSLAFNDADQPVKGSDEVEVPEESGSLDEDKLEPDYKGFYYVINYGRYSKFGPAVFTNLDEAILGNI